MNLYLYRNGESSPHFQRSDERIYNIEDEWYFTVRRGYDQGPYLTNHAARQALTEYVQAQLEFERQMSARLTSS